MMIHDLKLYPAYKGSGVPWLGNAPKHWDLRRMKTLVSERVEKGFPNEPLLAATQSKGVVLKDQYENRTVLALKDLHLLKLVRKGDFVISLRSFQGGIEVAHKQCIISPAYTILRSTDPEINGFLVRLFKSKPFVENLALHVTGIRQGQNIDYEKLSRSVIPVPPLSEQAAIVRFIDLMDRRIRRYIRAKQKLINLLEEQKQAIIHRAVTRGLDPNVRLKPSGMEWMGDVPEHWGVGPLKRFVAKRPGAIKAGPFGSQLTAAEMAGSDVKVYTQRNVIDRDLHKGVNYVNNAKFEALRAFRVFPGDVLVTSRGTIGRTALVKEDCHLGILHPCLLRVQPDIGRLIPEFLMTLIQDSQLLPQQLTVLSNATTIDVIYSGTLANIIVPVPPIVEQKAIISHLQGATRVQDQGIKVAYRQISLLREYRSRLFADVVTGKLDVREAAARLPDEPEELLGEMEALVDDEEDGQDVNLDAATEEAEA